MIFTGRAHRRKKTAKHKVIQISLMKYYQELLEFCAALLHSGLA
jgi:hypothetical protein